MESWLQVDYDKTGSFFTELRAATVSTALKGTKELPSLASEATRIMELISAMILMEDVAA